ncbi:hypothetical protein, partial [Pseudomonas versuta]|uniref:hypothetical protein n=1 Tax=Pseudomonas versuta TaxID=1788301 RepID=UPI000AAD1985
LASAAPSIAGAAAKGVKKVGKFVGGWQHKLQHAGGVPGGGRALPGHAQRVGSRSPMRDMDLSYLLEQGPTRESFLPRLSRGDLQNIGQTNSANRTSVYAARPPQPLELPFSGTAGIDNSQYHQYGYPVVSNPNYVNEVREIISGTHPNNYPWQIGEAGIQNPRQLRIIDRPIFEDYAAQRLAGENSWRPGMANYESDFRWFSQRGEIAQRGWNCRIL